MTKQERLENELIRISDMYAFQNSFGDPDTSILGIDEAGRGPLCGPVVAACVLLPENEPVLWLNDSKKLSEKKRDELFPIIKEKAITYGIGFSGPERIDQINILNATYEAMTDAYQEAVERFKENDPHRADMDPSFLVLVDGNKTVPGIHCNQITVVSGDARCPSISAASILAKVTRDRLLYEYDKKWPEYGFAKHKGYGTKEHIEALRKYGPLPIHRRTFIRNFT